MRIVHAISGIDPRNGGPTNALIGLAAAQVRAGLDVHVISTWQEKDAFRSADRLEAAGVGVRMVGQAHGKLSRHAGLEKNLIAEVSHADVVHVHAMWEEMQHQACRVAAALRRPYVMTPHGMLDPWNMTKSRWAKRLYLFLRMRRNLNHAALLHFTTAIERDWVARLKLRAPTIVEPLGLGLSDFNDLPAKGTFRTKYPQLGARAMILFLGRIHRGKGLELLVPALAELKRHDAMLVVAGPDSDGYRATIERLIDRHGVRERVIFTGMIGGRDKLAALVDTDLLAAPSYHENFGLAVIEALACGTPVVVSDQVNIHPEISAAQVGGVVPLDVGALARELDRWLADDGMRRAAAEKAPAFVRERYDWDLIAKHWVGHYERVLGGRVMRVLHVISSVDSRAGGPAVAMAGMAKAQRAAGMDVAMVATWREGSGQDIADDLRAAGVDVTLVGPARGPLQSHPDLARTMDEAVGRADVVHIHALFEAVQHQAAKSARRANRLYIFTPHGMLTPWSLRQKSLKKSLYMALRLRKDLDRAAALHFTTTQERDQTAKVGLAPRAIVEPLGVDLSEFQSLPPRGAFRDRHPQLAGRRVVMFLGRLHPGKGMEYLIPAMARMAAKDVMLVAVGPDSHGFQASLEALVDQHGVRDRVMFTGMLRGRDRIEALTDADLFALPSEHENFGVAVIEALACGVPVVISEGVAVKDEIVAAGVGSAVPIDIDRIAAELARWLSDEDLRRAAVEKARPFVWERFDWSKVASHWVEHYRSLARPR